MTINVSKLSFIELQNLLLPIKEKCPYPINHQDIDNYQQDIRQLLSLEGINSMPDVYTCQVYIHLNIWEFTNWEDVYERYTKDHEKNKINFYVLMGREQCICGQHCLHRFRIIFNYRHMHVGCVCINKDIFFSLRFKQYKKKVKPIYVLNKQYYKYVMYQAFKRFKFYKSKPIILKRINTMIRRPLYNAFHKLKMKPIVKPIVEPIKPIVKSIVKPIVEPIVKSIIKPIVEPIVQSIVKPIVEPIKGICVCGKKCGKYPRCSICEIEHKKTLPYTCKCGVKSSYICCYKCKQDRSMVLIYKNLTIYSHT
jgi:hypothetical protein